jgi:hypothetical protein
MSKETEGTPVVMRSPSIQMELLRTTQIDTPINIEMLSSILATLEEARPHISDADTGVLDRIIATGRELLGNLAPSEIINKKWVFLKGGLWILSKLLFREGEHQIIQALVHKLIEYFMQL